MQEGYHLLVATLLSRLTVLDQSQRGVLYQSWPILWAWGWIPPYATPIRTQVAVSTISNSIVTEENPTPSPDDGSWRFHDIGFWWVRHSDASIGAASTRREVAANHGPGAYL